MIEQDRTTPGCSRPSCSSQPACASSRLHCRTRQLRGACAFGIGGRRCRSIKLWHRRPPIETAPQPAAVLFHKHLSLPNTSHHQPRTRGCSSPQPPPPAPAALGSRPSRAPLAAAARPPHSSTLPPTKPGPRPAPPELHAAASPALPPPQSSVLPPAQPQPPAASRRPPAPAASPSLRASCCRTACPRPGTWPSPAPP